MFDLTQKKTEVRFLFFVFSLALVLRLAYLFFLRQHYFFYDHPSGDVTYYQKWAQEIASGNWLGDKPFYGLPLFPYFLAVLQRLCLGNLFAVRILHILLGTFNCILIYYVAKKLFSPKVAGLAAIFAATNFVLIYYDWLMMPVTLLIFLSLVIILSFLYIDTLHKRTDLFILGLLIGLGVLGDGKFLILSVLAGLYILFHNNKPLREKFLKILLPLGLGIFLVLFAVTLRNKIVGGNWVFISAQSGLSFYAGNNPSSTGIYENPSFIRPDHRGQDEDQKIVAETLTQKNLSAGEVSSFWRGKALAFIQENPGAYLNLLARKFLLFFKDTEAGDDMDMILQRQWKRVLDINPYFVICPLALLGMFFANRGRAHKDTAYVNLMVLSQLLVTMIFFLTTRHRTTILPYFLIYEAYFLVWAFEQIRGRHFRSLIAPLVFLFAFVIFFKPEPLDAQTIAFVRHAKSGPVYEKQKRYKEAQEEYLKALEVFPGDTNTLYNLATAHLLEGDLTQAQKLYLTVVNACPYNIDAWFNLGYTYEQSGDPERAVEAYKQVLKYDEEGFDALFRIAGIYQNTGDCPRAKMYYSRIIKAKPLLAGEIRRFFSSCESR
jgi:4-amino-4-deoxy-L-arabinose transferase-like glycosyltransferase